ncbi:MAG: T9SS type A sorting domain-containing protein, partial [Bacteroidetes bacterium]|nr:T9SS type A sorting domain-containing protein [Bacteroidota bacterium]
PPANKFVHILAGAGGPPKIESLDVINSVGENIFQLITGTLPLTIDVGGFNNGIYFLVIRKEEEIIVRKLLIRH